VYKEDYDMIESVGLTKDHPVFRRKCSSSSSSRNSKEEEEGEEEKIRED